MVANTLVDSFREENSLDIFLEMSRERAVEHLDILNHSWTIEKFPPCMEETDCGSQLGFKKKKN